MSNKVTGFFLSWTELCQNSDLQLSESCIVTEKEQLLAVKANFKV